MNDAAFSRPRMPGGEARQLGVCVVGLGLGRRYIELVQARSDARVVSVCAEHTERTAEVCTAYRIPFGSTDYRAAIDRTEVDLVVIASPDRLHFEQAAFALRAGKHVLCEKPIATTLDDARRLVDLVEANRRVFAAGHNYRFINQFATLHRLAEQHELGQVYLGEAAYVQDLWSMARRGANYWRFADPQNFFLGAAVHLVDFLIWCLGPVAEIHAYANHVLPFYPTTENYVASLRFAGGAIGQVVVALGSHRQSRFDVTLTLHGTTGRAVANNHDEVIVVERDEELAERPKNVVVETGDSIATELADVIASIHQQRRPLVTVRDGARAVAVCEAANRSIIERRPVVPEWV